MGQGENDDERSGERKEVRLKSVSREVGKRVKLGKESEECRGRKELREIRIGKLLETGEESRESRGGRGEWRYWERIEIFTINYCDSLETGMRVLACDVSRFTGQRASSL